MRRHQFDPTVVRAFLNISLGRLRWTVGPASWVALVPFLGGLSRAGSQLVIAAKSAAVVTTMSVGGVLHPAYAATRPSTPALRPAR